MGKDFDSTKIIKEIKKEKNDFKNEIFKKIFLSIKKSQNMRCKKANRKEYLQQKLQKKKIQSIHGFMQINKKTQKY